MRKRGHNIDMCTVIPRARTEQLATDGQQDVREMFECLPPGAKMPMVISPVGPAGGQFASLEATSD